MNSTVSHLLRNTLNEHKAVKTIRSIDCFKPCSTPNCRLGTLTMLSWKAITHGIKMPNSALNAFQPAKWPWQWFIIISQFTKFRKASGLWHLSVSVLFIFLMAWSNSIKTLGLRYRVCLFLLFLSVFLSHCCKTNQLHITTKLYEIITKSNIYFAALHNTFQKYKLANSSRVIKTKKNKQGLCSLQ